LATLGQNTAVSLIRAASPLVEPLALDIRRLIRSGDSAASMKPSRDMLVSNVTLDIESSFVLMLTS
jgi:hypothetical protein